MPKARRVPPQDTAEELSRSLKRWGMSDAEIRSATRKQKRRDALVMSAVKSKRARSLAPSAHAIPAAPRGPQVAPAEVAPAGEEGGVCTVRFAALQLGLHRKTVLRMIREGRLPAKRIGKSYRIRRVDLQAFAGLAASDSPAAAPTARPSITAIYEVPAVAQPAAERWMTLITAMLKGRPPGSSPVRAEVMYEEARSLLKIVVVGSPDDTLPLLEFVRAWQARLESP